MPGTAPAGRNSKQEHGGCPSNSCVADPTVNINTSVQPPCRVLGASTLLRYLFTKFRDNPAWQVDHYVGIVCLQTACGIKSPTARAAECPLNIPVAWVIQVALKMHKVVQDPREVLRTEAEIHVNAWVKLGHVIRPIGYLKAHDQTGTPAMLVLEVVMYVHQIIRHEKRDKTPRFTRLREAVTIAIGIRYTPCLHVTYMCWQLQGKRGSSPVRKKLYPSGLMYVLHCCTKLFCFIEFLAVPY